MTEASCHGAEILRFRVDVLLEAPDDLHERLGLPVRPGENLGAGWDRAVRLDLLEGDMRGLR